MSEFTPQPTSVPHSNALPVLPQINHPNHTHAQAPTSPNLDSHRILPKAHLGKLSPSVRTKDASLQPRSLSPGPPTTPSRSSSLRRKPVPNYLPAASNLPSNHPFATKSPTAGSGGLPMGRSQSDTPATPNTIKMEEDLFFTPPGRGAPPPLPRRTFSPVSAVSHRTGTPNSVASVQRIASPVSIHRGGTPISSKGTPVVDGKQEVLREKSGDTEAPNRPDTFHDGLEEKTDRPLPEVSADRASRNGDTLTPLADPFTPLASAPLARRSSSEDSPIVPLTAATTQTASQPSIRVVNHDAKTWDLASEVDFFDRKLKPVAGTSRGPITGKPSRTPVFPQFGPRAPLLPEVEDEDDTFSVDRIPSKRKMWEADTCFLRDEDGHLVCFGDLFPRWEEGHEGRVLRNNARVRSKEAESIASRRSPKTVVFFIRHFWCGQCQDYTFASVSLLDPVAIAAAGIRVVIISNGSWKIIKAYKKLFNCPFPIYVDGPRRLYHLLGMTKMTNDFGPMFKGRATYHQRPVPTQLLHGLSNAFFRMPLADPGKLTQLGGEFVLAPGYTCEFAHRMTTTSDHMEAPDVLRLAGCDAPTKTESAEIQMAESQKTELDRLDREMKEWREGRAAEIDRIRARKAARRGETYTPSGENRYDNLGLDEELGEGGDTGFAEYHSLGLPANVAIANDEVDERFRRVMAMEETRGREHEAASALGWSRERPRGLDVEVEG